MCGFLVWLYSLSMLPPMVVALFYKEKKPVRFLYNFRYIFLHWWAERGIQLRNLAFNYVPVMGLL
ncbi:Trk system potassium uptake protein [Escherichia coli]|nr:Trk system potassium uptake protein [Escherichia coli]